LGASLFAAGWVPLWLVVLHGRGGALGGAQPTLWHGHEMVFGYGVAVIAGFLLTAVRNWTGIPTPSGAPLAALWSVWLLGRLALVVPGVPPLAGAAVDSLFLPLLALAVGRSLIVGRNRRNYGMLALLGLLAVANAFTHSADADLARRALYAGVYLVILIIVVIGGRVIPSFTGNALPGVKIGKDAVADWAAFGATAAFALADTLRLGPPAVAGGLALVAGAANLWRMRGWASWHTRTNPMLWILHAGYVWVPVGLVLRGLAAFTDVAPTAALHALTAGAIGTLTLGMMSRVGYGHTGRAMVASRPLVAAFLLVSGAGLVRVFGPLAGLTVVVWDASGALWSAAFVLFVWSHASIFWRPRADGRAG
jgi:uncharacterized protein involved in response to NO